MARAQSACDYGQQDSTALSNCSFSYVTIVFQGILSKEKQERLSGRECTTENSFKEGLTGL
jgi:hypothetical protein